MPIDSANNPVPWYESEPEPTIDFARIGITDDLMFGTVLQDKDLCKGMVELLLGMEVESVELVESQRRIDLGPLSRAGVVDLLVRDTDGNTFDLEMQNRIEPDLTLRARRYLSLVDAMMLRPGQSFDETRGAVVIFICTHDPFGRGWKRYNFPRVCTQDGEPLGDRTDIVFVNAAGTRGDFGPGFDSFLRYLQNDRSIGSDYIRKLDDAVRSWRDNPVWRELRVLWSEKYRDDFANARRRGRDEGLVEGRREGLAEGRAQGEKEMLGRMLMLSQRLEAEGRGSDMLQAMHDEESLNQLFKEFGL